ncbi:MAG TPA: hypothetical protein VMW54_10745 [Terriglobia bacterium]|nr:hypothetical protein [Terriglobia bacterium]
MRGRGERLLGVVAIAVLSGPLFVCGASGACNVQSLTERQQAVLHAWLTRHKSYRLATDADCDCEDDISQMKSGYGGVWPKVKDYQPYIATGDFRGNGIMDFAVAVIDLSATKDRFTLLVFDGPFHRVDTPPVFVQGGLDLTYQGFSYGPPRPKPFRLVVGPFESDNTCILSPQGPTYRLDCN